MPTRIEKVLQKNETAKYFDGFVLFSDLFKRFYVYLVREIAGILDIPSANYYIIP